MKREEADKLTLQEACDFAVLKIVEQGGRCKVLYPCGEPQCMYKREDKHCAIGWLLDETREELMVHEGGIHSLIQEHAWLIPSIIEDNEKVFIRLQSFHDDPSYSGLRFLQRLGIDTSAPQWQQWLDMHAGGGN